SGRPAGFHPGSAGSGSAGTTAAFLPGAAWPQRTLLATISGTSTGSHGGRHGRPRDVQLYVEPKSSSARVHEMDEPDIDPGSATRAGVDRAMLGNATMACMPSPTAEELSAALPAAAREIEEFVGNAGWDQPAQVFALVPTSELLAAEPELADQLDQSAPLTPVAQEALPNEDLGEALAQIAWPEQVAGCAVAQEIVVLPPEAEAELPTDAEQARQAAAQHPQRQEARLVAAV